MSQKLPDQTKKDAQRTVLQLNLVVAQMEYKQLLVKIKRVAMKKVVLPLSLVCQKLHVMLHHLDVVLMVGVLLQVKTMRVVESLIMKIVQYLIMDAAQITKLLVTLIKDINLPFY